MKESGVMERVGSPEVRWRRWCGLVALALAVLATSLYHLHVIDREMGTTRSDLLVQLVGTRDALRGMDPYSPAVTRDIQEAFFDRALTPQDAASVQRFFYPATMVVLLAPLSHAPWEPVRIGFLCLMPVLLGLSAYLWIKIAALDVDLRTRCALVGLFVLSWPVLWALRIQQPTVGIAVLIAAAIYGVRRGWDLVSGMLLALSTVKPQLAGLLLLWLLVWAGVHRRWRLMSSFFATLAVLLAASEWLVPGWVLHWWRALHTYDTGKPALEMMLGRWAGLGTLALLCAWSGWNLWRLLRAGAEREVFARGVALVLALAVTAMPTRFPLIYNQVLLLPAVLLTFSRRRSGGSNDSSLADLVTGLTWLLVVWDYVAVAVAVVGESLEGPAHSWDAVPFLNILLPAVLVAGLNLQAGWNAGRDGASTREARA